MLAAYLHHPLLRPPPHFRAILSLQYPSLEPAIEDILPKKTPIIVAKWCVQAAMLCFYLSFAHLVICFNLVLALCL